MIKNSINSKKGQISIFIIIGIIILIFISILVYQNFNQDTVKISQTDLKSKNEQINYLNSYITECLGQISKDSLIELSTNGGKIYSNEEKLINPYFSAFYSYELRKNKVLSIPEMEYELNRYIEENINECINYTKIESVGLKISNISFKSDTSINKENIEFKTYSYLRIENTPVEIVSGYKLDSRLFQIQEFAYNLTEKLINDPNWIDLTYIANIDFITQIVPNTESDFYITIIDDKYKLNDKNLIYIYALKFPKYEEIDFELPDKINIVQNTNFRYQIKANKSYTYSDNTFLFDISENGIISFIPKLIGNFNVTITAKDEFEKELSKNIEIIIK